jgi:hypothetical protein
MILKILNKQNFIQNFLSPIAKVNDLCSLTLENNSIYSFNRTVDGTFTLYSFSNDIVYEGDKRILSFSEITKFIKAFSTIPQEEDIELKLNENSIEYKSHLNKFKFHLINDNIVKGPSYNLDKLNSLEFNLEFVLSYAAYLNLLKSSTFISSEKIYIYTEDNKVYGELTDKTKNNVDSYTLLLSENYNGSECNKPLAFNFNLFRSISTQKNLDLSIKLNTRGILVFDIQNDKYKLKYISTAHVS